MLCQNNKNNTKTPNTSVALWKRTTKIGNSSVLLWRNVVLSWKPPEICHSCSVCLHFNHYTPPSAVTCIPLVLQSAASHETGVARVLCRVVPLERFKPFFDSFQGAFKDNHRYFAGLYFIYRLVPLVLYVALSSKVDFFFYFEIQLILMLGLHALIWPYKESRHNRYDLYIFVLLLTINRITSYNYQWTVHQRDSDYRVKVFSTIQVLLAYTPVLFMGIWLLVKLWKKIKCKCSRKRLQSLEEDDNLTLSLSELDQRLESKYRDF